MKSKHDNPFDLLAELELNAGDANDMFASTDVFTDLRFDEEELEIDDSYQISVSVVRATLQLELWGSDIVPGTRLNDHAKGSMTRRRTIRQQLHRSGGAEGGVGIDARRPIPAAEAKVKVQGQVSRDQCDEYEEVWTEERVIAKSGKRWLIEEPNGRQTQQNLIGTYINNQRLCKIEAKERANSVEVVGRITIRRGDIIATPDGNPVQKTWRALHHKQKFLAAVLAKAIVEGTNQTSTEDQTGRITLAKSTLTEAEDDAS
ncbi:hypothetical protein [Yoonia algicola]|uniref:Uncharacterized protein n=1 Tax=Yoonia algicola TaxID=3137368 RepID=A0AAN0NHC8_9RHOB